MKLMKKAVDEEGLNQYYESVLISINLFAVCHGISAMDAKGIDGIECPELYPADRLVFVYKNLQLNNYYDIRESS